MLFSKVLNKSLLVKIFIMTYFVRDGVLYKDDPINQRTIIVSSAFQKKISEPSSPPPPTSPAPSRRSSGRSVPSPDRGPNDPNLKTQVPINIVGDADPLGYQRAQTRQTFDDMYKDSSPGQILSNISMKGYGPETTAYFYPDKTKERAKTRETFDDMYKDSSPKEILSNIRIEGYGPETRAVFVSPLIMVQEETEPKFKEWKELKTGEKLERARDKFVWTFSGARYKGVDFQDYKETEIDRPDNFRNTLVGWGESVSVWSQGLTGRWDEIQSLRAYDEKGLERSPTLLDKAQRGGVRFIGALGDKVVGESLQKPEQTILLYGVGVGVGVGAKAFKMGFSPIYNKIALELVSAGRKTPSVAWATKGVGVGLKGGAVLGVGGLVAEDLVLADDKLGRSVEIGRDMFLSGLGFKTGYKTTFRDLTVKATSDTFFIDSSPRFDYVPMAGKQSTVQATFTRSGGFGGYISDKEIIRKTGQDLFLAKGSPLGLPRDYYKGLQTGLKAGKVSSRGFAEPYKFFEPRVSAKTGDPFGADLVRVGEVQKKLAEPIVRVVNIRTGKERDVASRFLDKTLAEDSALKVVGVTKKKDLLFASDPFGAIVIGVQEKGFIGYKPSFVTSSPSMSVFQQPILEKPLKIPFSFPIIHSPSLTQSQDLPSIEMLGVQATQIEIRTKKLDVQSISTFGLLKPQSKVAEGVLEDQLVGGRGRTMSISASITKQIPMSQQVQVSKTVTKPHTPQIFVPVRTTVRYDPRSLDPTPSPVPWGYIPKIRFPTSTPSFKRSLIKRSSGLGSLVTARPGSKYIIAPGRRTPGDVFKVNLEKTEELRKRKKREDWWRG